MNDTKTVADTIAAVDDSLSVLPGFDKVVDEIINDPYWQETDIAKPDLDTVCYVMNAQEVDAQNALREIVAIMNNLKQTVNNLDNALEMMGV